MRRKKNKPVRLLAFLLIFSLLFAACGGNKEAIAPENNSVIEDVPADSDLKMKKADVYSAYAVDESKISGGLDSVSDGRYKEPLATKTPDMPMAYEKASDIFLPPDEYRPVPVPQAGLLTAAEWNDNKNPDFLLNLLANGQDYNYKNYFTKWNLTPFNRLKVNVTTTANVTNTSGGAISGATVSLLDGNGSLLFTAVSDNSGSAYLFYNLNSSNEFPASVLVTCQENSVSRPLSSEDLVNKTIDVSFDLMPSYEKKLDLMFVVDTTGSMGDEIFFLQKELEDVIRRVQKNNANLSTRLSVNFYRDVVDEYVINPHPFSDDIPEQLTYLAAEYASGGGDYEEAVEQALHNAVYDHEFAEGSTRLLFLVCDAPAHNTEAIKAELASTLRTAAEKGIRIIPVASSGVDKDTEFLLRSFAMITGGTYTFLTNDSGIGEGHIEPTVGDYSVESLNNLLVRVIDSYLE